MPADPARDPRTSRTVMHGGRRCVLKHLGPASDDGARRRHASLVARLRALRHPGLSEVLQGGVGRPGHPRRRWLLAAWVDGTTADEVVADGGIDVGRALPALVSLAGGLAALHAAGVLHRDVAPGNVVLSREGGAVLIDFGHAVLAEELPAASVGVVGTPGYVAPEEVLRGPAAWSPALDVYGLGAVGFALLAGGAPARGEDVLDALAAATRRSPTLADLGVAVPAALDDLLREALAPEPSSRPDAATMAARLAALVRGRTGSRGPS